MSNSSLVTYRHIVSHKTTGRGGNEITKIFVHHMAGNLTVKQCGSVFDNRQASAHYGINRAAIGQYVDEKDTAWHCGNFKWNQKSIGIELANDGGAGSNWHVADETINTAVRLIADICKRNGIKRLNYTGDMTGNLCMHKWGVSTSCPGPYLSKQFRKLADEVNKRLATSNKAKTESKPYTPSTPYTGGLPSGTVKKGSKGTNVKHVQKFLNWCIGSKLDVDGVCGGLTDKAIRKYQKQYGLKVDGIFGSQSKKKAQAIIKAHAPVPAPKPTPAKTDPLQPWFDAMKTQFNWSKNQRYHFNDEPTVANSKKEGTCITFPAVSLQRLGLLPKGKYFYLYPKTMRIAGNGASYVKKHTEIYSLSYPNKTLKQLRKEGKVKKGDIVGFGGSAYHTMVYMGTNKDGDSIFNTMGHKKGLSVTYPFYAKKKVNMIVRIKKIK